MKRRGIFALVILCVFLLAVAASAKVNPHYQAGKLAFDEKDFSLAMKEWKAGAEQGDANCINAIGALYWGGMEQKKTSVRQ